MIGAADGTQQIGT